MPLAAAAQSVSLPDQEGVAAHRERSRRGFMLALGAIGVVYGDVGTNPLFAMRECFKGHHGVALVRENIIGSTSLAVWALILIVCIKYTMFVLRADNEGEGGALALLGKVPPSKKHGLPTRPIILVVVLLFGSTLLLGDGVVTPAISVLSAVEGLGVAQNRVVLYTVVILASLFLVQRFGTTKVGRVFGPIMCVWFLTLAVLGTVHIVMEPSIFTALDPRHAVHLLTSGQPGSFMILGAIILCVGGGEALYADLGHFGRTPIVRAWYTVVFPALVLMYLGQGALLLDRPSAVSNPFFEMSPWWFKYPLVLLATIATVIASQAMISGSYSLARQATNLGFLPRLTVKHTSLEETGQIYVPFVNSILMCGSVTLVISFGSSEALAGAYGLATNLTMTTTTIGFFFIMWRVWKVNVVAAAALVAVFLAMDLSFLAANTVKIPDGGYVPLAVGGSAFALALMWRWGRRTLAVTLLNRTVKVVEFLEREDVKNAIRVPGTAVFLTSSTEGMPPVLAHHFERNSALHEQVVLLSIQTLDIPFVEPKRRLVETEIGGGFYRVIARFGYDEIPNVPLILEACAIHGLVVDFEHITYVLGRDALRLKHPYGLRGIPRRIFAFMSRNQASTFGYFNMPVERVIEIGMQLEL